MSQPCPRGTAGCGQEHPGCIGHNVAGNPCGAIPMRGTGDRPRCRRHLGRSPEIVRAEYEAERLALQQFEAEQTTAARHGLDPINPLEELLKLAAEVTRWKDICHSMVGHLEEIRYRSGKSGEQVRAEITLYERSMDRAARILADITRLGIEARLASVNEETAARLMRVIDGVVSDLGHNPYAPYEASIILRWLPVLQGLEPKRVVSKPPPPRAPGTEVELRP